MAVLAAGIGAAKTVCEMIRLFSDQAYIGELRRGKMPGGLSEHPAGQTEEWCMKFNRPTEEQIRSRAHEIFLQHGSQPGHDLDNWLQAEYELMQWPLGRIARALKATKDRRHEDRPRGSFVAGGGGRRDDRRSRD
jgi:hypothetical protein